MTEFQDEKAMLAHYAGELEQKLATLEAEVEQHKKTMNAMAKCENIEEARRVMSEAIMVSDILLPGDQA